jgi:hypothetical protein
LLAHAFDLLSDLHIRFTVLKVPSPDHKKKLSNSAKAHQKIEAIVRLKEAFRGIILEANQLAELTDDVQRRQNNVDGDHQNKNENRRKLSVNLGAFLPGYKNKDRHAKSIDVVGYQNKFCLVRACSCGHLLAIWHKKYAVTHKERHKFRVKQ